MLASTKQENFIASLLVELGADPAEVNDSDRSGLTKRDASHMITTLLDKKKNVAPVQQTYKEVDRKPARKSAPEGIHFLDGEVYKVQVSQSSGYPYALRLVGTKWDYDSARGKVRSLSEDTKISREDAAAYGQRTGVCCICGRTLRKKASIAAGIGPICAGGF